MTPRAAPDAEVARAFPIGREIQTKLAQKKRMIALLRMAANAPDPTQVVPQVRALNVAWLAIGNVGPETAALVEAYEDAIDGFWRAVRAIDPRRESPVESLPEHVLRLKRWLGI